MHNFLFLLNICVPDIYVLLRVSLFGGEIRRMKNFGEKIRKKTFLEHV